MPVHYAGVACEMEAIYEAIAGMSILVIEDAAQGLRQHAAEERSAASVISARSAST